jgi:alpha-1,3-fucosyltransferase
VCEDYVTEKYYNIMKYNLIPVTYNGANMSLYGPPHSSINALDFETSEDLAKYLKEVEKYSFLILCGI